MIGNVTHLGKGDSVQRFRWSCLFSLIAVALTACQSVALPTNTPPPSLAPTLASSATNFYLLPPDWQNPIYLKLGETVVLAHGGLRITFMQVVEDTRCGQPTCLAKGNAQVRLYVKLAEEAVGEAMLLNTRPDLTLGANYIGYSIALRAVEPDLATISRASQRDYSILIDLLMI